MTKAPTEGHESERCRWCRRPLPERAGTGRPRTHCRQACRQRDYEARRRAAAHGLDEAELVVARADADRLRDAIYVLRCAVEDVGRDLADDRSPRAVEEALAWVLAGATTVLEASGDTPTG